MYKISIVTGFRPDQQITIDASEAHKAYYLFLHPDERGVFSNGVALIGRDIRQILPDFNTTMGWNPQHRLTEDDWALLRRRGVETRMNAILELAKEVGKRGDPAYMQRKLSDVRYELGLPHPDQRQVTT